MVEVALDCPWPDVREPPSPPDTFEGDAPLRGPDPRGGELEDVRKLRPGSGAFAPRGSGGGAAEGPWGVRLSISMSGPKDNMSWWPGFVGSRGRGIVPVFLPCRDMLERKGRGSPADQGEARREGGSWCLPSLALRRRSSALERAAQHLLACWGIAAGQGASHGADLPGGCRAHRSA